MSFVFGGEGKNRRGNSSVDGGGSFRRRRGRDRGLWILLIRWRWRWFIGPCKESFPTRNRSSLQLHFFFILLLLSSPFLLLPLLFLFLPKRVEFLFPTYVFSLRSILAILIEESSNVNEDREGAVSPGVIVRLPLEDRLGMVFKKMEGVWEYTAGRPCYVHRMNGVECIQEYHSHLYRRQVPFVTEWFLPNKYQFHISIVHSLSSIGESLCSIYSLLWGLDDSILPDLLFKNMFVNFFKVI